MGLRWADRSIFFFRGERDTIKKYEDSVGGVSKEELDELHK
jgi:hypothetical protein